MTKTDAVSTVAGEKTGTNFQPLKGNLEMLNSGLCSVFLGTFRMMAALDEQCAEEMLNNLVWARTELKDNSLGASVVRAEPKAVKDKTVAAQKTTVTAEKSIPMSQNSKPITRDDLIKIIVQKIKKDRSNNEKIGRILESYGVSKVSLLPEGKYEAFLTDLSAI